MALEPDWTLTGPYLALCDFLRWTLATRNPSQKQEQCTAIPRWVYSARPVAPRDPFREWAIRHLVVQKFGQETPGLRSSLVFTKGIIQFSRLRERIAPCAASAPVSLLLSPPCC